MKISRRVALGAALAPLFPYALENAGAAPKVAASSAAVPKGMWPAMLTPFQRDGSVDWKALEALTDWYIEAGSDGLFACCASSEVWTLSEDERIRVTATVVKRAGKIPVVSAGLPGREPKAVASYVERLKDTGVRAVVLMTNQVAEENEPDSLWRDRVEAILEATCDVPFGMYEVPSPYKRLLTPEMMHWAARTGRFVFLKDTSCDINQIAAKCEEIQGSVFRLFNAHVPILVDAIQKKADGFCGIASNGYPHVVAYATHHAHEPEKVAKVQEFLTKNEKILSLAYPLSAKVLASLAGVPIQPVCRRKTRDINSDQMQMLRDLRKAADSLLA